jgi:hypothetical protein
MKNNNKMDTMQLSKIEISDIQNNRKNLFSRIVNDDISFYVYGPTDDMYSNECNFIITMDNNFYKTTLYKYLFDIE